MNFEDLSPELQERAKACKTADELRALAEAEGLELSDEQLEAVAGGGTCDEVLMCLGDSCTGFRTPIHCSQNA